MALGQLLRPRRGELDPPRHRLSSNSETSFEEELGAPVIRQLQWFYRPALKYFRSRRMRKFYALFRPSERTTILDVGGLPLTWKLLPVTPKVTLLNLEIPPRPQQGFVWIRGDGRHLPFRDKAFDIVFSNSVIEHIGHPDDQRLFAHEIRRVGRGYWVQTPNFWFPVEPHLLTPFFHWLPKRLQLVLLRNFTVTGWFTRPTAQQCWEFVEGTRLLAARELKELFPDGKILRERLFGLTKSLVAYKSPAD